MPDAGICGHDKRDCIHHRRNKTGRNDRDGPRLKPELKLRHSDKY